MSEIEETAKALAESAKFGTKSIESAEKALGFLAKVFNEPIEQAAGIVGDKLKFIRWKRQERMIDEAKRLTAKRGLAETRAVPPKFALPILTNATLEENDELQDLWIKLLVNSMDSNFDEEMRYAFIEIIKSLSPTDARLLKKFYDELVRQNKDLTKLTDHSITKEQISGVLAIPIDETIVSIYNLFRVQCLVPAILKGGARLGNEPITIYKGVDAVTMTPLGLKFIRACMA